MEHNVAVTEVETYDSDKIDGQGYTIRITDTAVPVLNMGITQTLSRQDYAIHEIYQHNALSEYHVYVYPRDALDEYVDESIERQRERDRSNQA